MKKILSILKKGVDLFEVADDPQEPAYDPVHLGAVLVINLVVIGVLYWLLWTLLVYEGGLFIKMGALSQVLFTSKTLRDFGYEDSRYQMGVFEGWVGNVLALALSVLIIAALHRLYQAATRKK